MAVQVKFTGLVAISVTVVLAGGSTITGALCCWGTTVPVECQNIYKFTQEFQLVQV